MVHSLFGIDPQGRSPRAIDVLLVHMLDDFRALALLHLVFKLVRVESGLLLLLIVVLCLVPFTLQRLTVASEELFSARDVFLLFGTRGLPAVRV